MKRLTDLSIHQLRRSLKATEHAAGPDSQSAGIIRRALQVKLDHAGAVAERASSTRKDQDHGTQGKP